MKKYLLPILIPSLFIAFVTYATIKTSATSINSEGIEEVVLVESVADNPEKVEGKKKEESLTTFVASPVFSIENETEVSKPVIKQDLESKSETETKVIKKYYDDDGDDDSEYEDEEDGEWDDD